MGLTCMRLLLHIRDNVASTKEIPRCPVPLHTSTLKMKPVFASRALYPPALLYVAMENTGEKQK